MSSRSSRLNKLLQKGGGSETLFYVAGLFVVIFIIIFIYFKTIGYTVNFGWDKVFFMFEKKQPIDVSVTEDGQTVASATLEPATGSVQAPPPAAAPPASLGIPDSPPSSANGTNRYNATMRVPIKPAFPMVGGKVWSQLIGCTPFKGWRVDV